MARVDQGYEAFCMADASFYDAMHSDRTAGVSFPTADRSLPEGWGRGEQDDWFVFTPPAGDRVRAGLPEQGWKIHASACLDNAPRILDAVWDYCVERGIEFKFLRSPSALVARVSKYAPREASGKLVTIYPASDAECETILTELGGRLGGEPSPYILSDLRWGRGPLYVRYGGFAMRHCVADDGRIVPAIADDSGALVPDRRGPVFYVPPWVDLPDFLAPHLAERNAVTVTDLPYSIERVLHFSNGGGIYVARDNRTGNRVVLKEARPHAGLDGWGHDAVRRLEREHDILRRLAGIPGVPEVYDHISVGEHRFLAMEHVDGQPLSRAIVGRYPLIDPAAGPGEFADFAAWATDVYRQAETTLTAIHERGIVYGDLHLFNLMLDADDRVVLLDYEVAAPVETATAPGLGNQGFSAPPGTTGLDIDRYALACLKIALFLPLTPLLWLHRAKVRHFARIIDAHLPIPAGYLTEAVDRICPPTVGARQAAEPVGFEPDRDAWPRLRDQLAKSIVASATPDRWDRLFPGDIEQFAVGGLGLAYGAAGVLYALSVTGADRHPELEDWLVSRVRDLPGGTRPGLYDGLHGAAYVLELLGHRAAALDAVDRCLRGGWEALGPELAGGLSGIGLNLFELADRTGEPALRLAAQRAVELVAARYEPEPDDPAEEIDLGGAGTSGGEEPNAGLLRGGAGAALFLLRAYERSGEADLLDRAATALRHDLRRCVVRDNGSLEVNEGWRTMPYLDVGSVGIGMVLDEYLRHREHERFAAASGRIRRAAQAEFYILPGLFSGRAGILTYLAGRATTGSAPADPEVTRQIRGLAWHALPYADGIAFPGTGLLRLSMDLATGTAGVLLALGSALHDEPVRLPLFVPSTRPAAAGGGAPHPPTPASIGAGSQVPELAEGR